MCDIFKLSLGSWMTTYLGKSCLFGFRKLLSIYVYLVISLLVLIYGVWLCQSKIIAYLFTFQYLSWTDSVKPSLLFSNIVGSQCFQRIPFLDYFIGTFYRIFGATGFRHLKAEHRFSRCYMLYFPVYLSWIDSVAPSLLFSNFVGSLYFRRIPFSDYLSLVTRKPVFGICDQLRLKPAYSADETV